MIVDAKSGVSGAGRTLKASSHAGSVLENVVPYKVGSHQHAPELEQALGFPVCFVPHLLPVRRGLIATCYVRPLGDLREALEAAYATAAGRDGAARRVAPELSRVQGTDAAEVGVFTDRSTGTGIVVCALDNLGKGAAGQAVQNANLALGTVRDRGSPPLRSARMSVTAAKGFAASGVRAGIRRNAKDLAVVRSTVPAVGSAMFTVNQVLAAPVVISKQHLAVAEPQAIVINSGVANAATGERGELDALATAAEAGRLLDLDAEEVLVLSTGVIGALLPLEKVLGGLRDGCAGALPGRRAGRRRGDPDDRHAHEGVCGLARGIHGRRDGEGLGDDPSAARDDARGRHDRLPARAGRGARLPAPRGRPELQLDLGRRRVLDERRRLPARERRQRDRAHARVRHRLRAGARTRLRGAGRADRRRRRGRDGARRDRGHRRGRRRPGARDRRSDRHLAARQDGALRPRRELGPRPGRSRLGALERRLRGGRGGEA